MNASMSLTRSVAALPVRPCVRARRKACSTSQRVAPLPSIRPARCVHSQAQASEGTTMASKVQSFFSGTFGKVFSALALALVLVRSFG